MTAWLDTGAFIAVERRDRQIGAKLRVLQLARVPLKTSAAVVAHVWRDGSAGLLERPILERPILEPRRLLSLDDTLLGPRARAAGLT